MDLPADQERDPGPSRTWIGLPAYNEAAVLPELLGSLARHLEGVGRPFRLLVVDDGSTDGTREVLGRGARDLPLTAVHHDQNQNLGGAMRSLFRAFLEHAGAEDVLVCMDADNTFRAEQVEALVAAVHRGADLVVASRYVPGGGTVGVPWHRRLLSFGANQLFRRLLPIPGVTEYTCSFRAYRRSLLQEARDRMGDPWIREDGFTCMPEILVRLAPLVGRVAQVPVCIRYDLKAGPSKMRVLRNVRRTLGLLRRLRRDLRAGVPPAPAASGLRPGLPGNEPAPPSAPGPGD